MKSLRGLFLLCFFHTSLTAQHGFDPGYIVKHNRDTVKGFIETTEGKSLSSSVLFKKEMNGEIKEYNPKENKMDTVFARQLVSGLYNLFTCVKSARFFLLQKDTSIFLLCDESQDGAGTVRRLATGFWVQPG